MRASLGCVRRVAADLCRSPTVMSMTTGSVSVRHVTDHYPSSAVGQLARHRHTLERASRQRGRHRASGPRANRTPVTISRRREERAHRGCAVAPGQRDYPRVLSGDPAADFAGSLSADSGVFDVADEGFRLRGEALPGVSPRRSYRRRWRLRRSGRRRHRRSRATSSLCRDEVSVCRSRVCDFDVAWPACRPPCRTRPHPSELLTDCGDAR